MRHNSRMSLIRRLFAPKPPRRNRITLIESRDFLMGPLLAEVMRYPYFDWRTSERRDHAPDQCVISRSPGYTLERKYDGLTIDIREIPAQEKMECLKLVLQKLASQRRSLR